MKVLVIGSGPERIGKTGELDRFAYRAVECLRKKDIRVVYVDSNPASIAASPEPLTTVYIEALTLANLERIIERERPDGILHAFGGRLAVHLAVFLEREGVLDQYGVRVLGTSVPSLKRLLEREVFRKTLGDLNVPQMDERVAYSISECTGLSQEVGFPLIVQPSFALEGNGGYLAYNVEEVKEIAPFAFGQSPVREVGIRRVEHGWVQLVIEGMHEPAAEGKIHVAGTFEPIEGGTEGNMGDVPVLAPSPTLGGELLERAVGLCARVAGKLELVGSFHVRFGYRKSDDRLEVIRIHPGLSRLTSLASYFSPFDIAEANIRFSLGDRMPELLPSHAPALQPGKCRGISVLRVPLDRYTGHSTEMTVPSMSSLGAEIALGATPVDAMAKAIGRCLEDAADLDGASPGAPAKHLPPDSISDCAKRAAGAGSAEGANPYRELNPAIVPALREAWEKVLAGCESDRVIRGSRESAPVLEREVPRSQAEGTQWLFLPESAGRGLRREKALGSGKSAAPVLLILGPGPYSVGWGPEMDQALLKVALALKKRGFRLVLINSNPDSTAHDGQVFDAVYLERPTCDAIERVSSEWEVSGLIHQFCRRLPRRMADSLERMAAPVMGTPLASMAVLNSIPMLWNELGEMGVPLLDFEFACEKQDFLRKATKLGFPLLVRLSDTGVAPPTQIIYDNEMLDHFFERYGARCSERFPFYLERFREGLIGAESLAVCNGTASRMLLFLEDIEEYGIHHDDCASIIPAWSIGDHQIALVEEVLNRIVHRFGIIGYLRLCVAVERRKVYVTGLSPYPGRNSSFFERTAGDSLHEAAASVLIGEPAGLEQRQAPWRPRRFYVKESVFPFQRFPLMDPALSPMMSSTGQVMGHDDNFGKAYIKSQIAVNPRILKKGKVFVSGRDAEKESVLQVAQKLLELNFPIVSTQGTAHFFMEKGVRVEKVNKVSERRPTILDLIKNDEISLVINIPGGFKSKQDELIIRRVSTEHNIPLVTTISGALLIVKGIEELQRGRLDFAPLGQ